MTAWVFLMPLVVYFIIFQLAPIVLSFLISLTDWNGISDFDMADMWVGFDNYIEAMTNSILYPDFWPSFGTTFLYVLLTVPASIILAVAVAAMLNSHIKGEKFFKTCFYIPSVTAGVAVNAIWIHLIDPSRGVVGLINDAFDTNINLLGSSSTALLTLAVMSIWGGLGYNVLIVLSSMKNINSQLYEACEIDGGGVLAKFFSVTVPNIMPTIFFLVITSTIGGLQAFDQMYLMTGGAYGTTTVMLEIYGLYMDQNQVGMASSMSYILFLFVIFFTFIQYQVIPSGDGKAKSRRKGGFGDARRLMLELRLEAQKEN